MMLVGIFIGAAFFAALIWSVMQAVRCAGALRIAHGVAALLSLSMMSTLTILNPVLATITGGLLILSAVTAMILDSGWARLFPIAQILVGVAVAVGMPFAI